MTVVDLAFPLLGTSLLPADHGYHLYSALSLALPKLHAENGIAIHPISGQQLGNRQLRLNDRSRLVLRADSGSIGELIKLAGKALTIAGNSIRVGVPQVWALKPAAALRSRLVVIKIKEASSASNVNEENFSQAARRQLDALGVSTEVILTFGKRRTLRIKDKEIVGYEVILQGLSAEESLDIQTNGIGGRRHMGCGVFAPAASNNRVGS